MKTMTYLKLVLLTVLAINLTSCEVSIDDFYDDDNINNSYYNKSRDLCSQRWVDTYIDVDGNRCRQELDFYMDRTGVDYIRVDYPNGRFTENEYYFNWNWENRGQTVLRMEYGPRDVSYLRDVYIGGNVLSGYLDNWNNFVDFVGQR